MNFNRILYRRRKWKQGFGGLPFPSKTWEYGSFIFGVNTKYGKVTDSLYRFYTRMNWQYQTLAIVSSKGDIEVITFRSTWNSVKHNFNSILEGM